jgi:sugar transferase EpsL
MLKRAFDISVSLLLLFLLLPLLLVLSFLILIFDGNPILFIQSRSGFHGVEFKLFKFRTMQNNHSSNSSRNKITRLGSILRKTSLDELPSLFNVIKGDMSLVGPRPLLMDYLPYYSKDELKRFAVKPGLTGLAQINGRNLISWDEKIKYDLLYVSSNNFFLDIKIMCMTLFKVFKSEGIYDNDGKIYIRFDDWVKQNRKNL